jgi:pyruvate kinase
VRLIERRSLPSAPHKANAKMEQILEKRTKIVATVGPASEDPAILRSLFISGANVLRLNFSHGVPDEHGAVIASARKISAELGIHTAILQDLPGPKVRTGPLAGGVSSVRLERGARFVITSEQVAGTAERVSTSYRDLPADVAIGKRLYLQDGQIALLVVDKSAIEIETTVEFGGDLRSAVGINYPDGSLNIASVTPRDFEYLAFGLEHGVDYVALSFVRSAEDVERAKAGKTHPSHR